MKKILTLMALVAITGATALAQDKQPIDVAKLPSLAQSNLKAYYSDVEITEAATGTGKLKNEYYVTLANGTRLTFDKHGQWTEVVANEGGEIPTRMVNGRVQMYLSKNHPGAKVVRMKKDKKSNYEFDLDDGKNLYFNEQFAPITPK